MIPLFTVSADVSPTRPPITSGPVRNQVKILLLSFYYPPDLCAGSFRAAALVEALREVGRDIATIDVMTTRPNRYASHAAAPVADVETVPGLTIRRFNLPPHQSGIADQMRAYRGYATGVWRATRGRKWDLVVATSSRLMTAALGAEVAKHMKARFYVDLRDLFTDTASGLFGAMPMRVALPALRWLERRTLKIADRVNVVSPGFVPYLTQVLPTHDYRVFTNGIDEVFLSQDFHKPDAGSSVTRLIVYAGNIGDGQGLHLILPEAARTMTDLAEFRIIGDGGRRAELEESLAAAGTTNVTLLPPVPREDLFEHYRDADALFLHLNHHAAFQKVLPSKIFEYAATGKPIVAGVTGVAADFLRSEVGGVALFAPCDPDGMARAVESLEEMPSKINRSLFRARYPRRDIMKRMANDILDLGEIR